MLLIYKILIFISYPFFILAIFIRILLKKENKIRYKEKIFPLAFNSKRNSNKKLIWFHASSIGEFLSIIPLIDRLNLQYKNLEFLITTVTLSSANLFKKKFHNYNNINHRFIPFDASFLVNSFLEAWKPNIVCFVDSEIWPNFFFQIKKKKIHLILLNGRITKKTFNRWNAFPKFAKRVFNNFDLCLASSEESKNNLINLNVKNTRYLGNLKFCSKINFNKLSDENESILNNFKIWCAASTHEGEEDILIKSHIILKDTIKNIKTIIIPRHIDRVASIKSLADNHHLNSQIIDNEEKINKDSEIIIVNSFGVLDKYYRYCKVVLIGKSLLKKFQLVGGQSPIDAAKFGCKILHGPYVYNFFEIYEFLNSMGISFQINNEKNLAKKLEEILNIEDRSNNSNKDFLENYGEKILKETLDSLKNYINFN